MVKEALLMNIQLLLFILFSQATIPASKPYVSLFPSAHNPTGQTQFFRNDTENLQF